MNTKQSPLARSYPLKLSRRIVYETYWKFAAERQRIFFKRVTDSWGPWTEDRILQQFKFTNAYRASDRVSQYLIRRVIYRDDLPIDTNEVFFRILLFKLFNRVDTWQLLEREIGKLTLDAYSYDRFDSVLTAAMQRGESIYSAAYIMPSGKSLGSHKKHRNHLRLLELMLKDALPMRLQDTRSMKSAFELLLRYPTIGDFLAYQYIIDINYSNITNFSEMDFVVPGPGAIDGIRKCFNDPSPDKYPDIIRMMAESQESEFSRLKLNFQSLWGRPLQLVDCQNLFCEVDKYARVAHPNVAGKTQRTRIKQRFQPNSGIIDFWYPPKWNINDAVSKCGRKEFK